MPYDGRHSRDCHIETGSQASRPGTPRRIRKRVSLTNRGEIRRGKESIHKGTVAARPLIDWPLHSIMPMFRWSVLASMTFVAGCGMKTAAPAAQKDPAVVISADKRRVPTLDVVTFNARIRPDLAATMKHTDSPGDPTLFDPHIVGWHWIPDIDLIDPWTKACETRELSCRTVIHGSGTMVFSIRTRDQVCADWVHIDAISIPDVSETEALTRLRADSISMAISTKAPMWRRCAA
jgi:hypothetical protein